MPIITDNDGKRSVSTAELNGIRVEAAARFDTFWETLSWRPIAEFDVASEQPELVRNGDDWALGYFGPAFPDELDTVRTTEESAPAWRNAQDLVEGEPLAFEPTEFAQIDAEWRAALMAG